MNRLVIFTFISIFFITGCNKNSGSDDIIKITGQGHEIIQKYSAFQSENAINEAVINYRAGNLDKAIQLLTEFTTYHPDNSVGFLYLSKAYYENDEYKKGLYQLKRAIRLDSSIADELAGPVIGRDIIGRVFLTNQINEEKNLAQKPKAWFDESEQTIYASLEIINAPPETDLEAKWFYELSKSEQVNINSTSFTAAGSKNAILSIKKPDTGWPAGRYKLEILVNDYENTSLNFYVF